MVQEPELEEGETCYYKDDTSIDPDIALSYIGDKVQSILGHFQKDFEGGVSAENLGAKFGGYGSFLPMHQRSPSNWPQPKSPLRVQNPHLPRSPNRVCPEGVIVPDAPSTQKNDSSSSPSIRASQTLKTSFKDASVRQKGTLYSDKVDNSFPGRVELPSSKLGNPPDQRTLKVRIKVGPDRVAQYNAEIYNLGLTSPSSSEENSHDESDGLLLESHETPNESPANILQMMTSLPVSGGLLVSPLCEDLLNLAREPEYSVGSEYKAAPKTPAVSVRLLNNVVSGGKKTKFIDKSGNFEKPEDAFAVDLNDYKQKPLGSDNRACSMQPFHDLNCNPLSDTVSESKNDIQVKNRKESKDRGKGRAVSGDLFKDASFERTSDQSCGKYEQTESRCSSVEKVGEHRARILQEDVSVDHGQGSRAPGNANRASFKAYSDNSEGEEVKGAMDNLNLKVGPNATSSEYNGYGTPHALNRLSSEGKKISKGKSSGKSASKADNLGDGGCAAQEKKYSGKKDVRRLHLSQKDVVHTGLEYMENTKHLLERPSGDKPKNFTLETGKAKSAYADKLKEKSSNKKYFDKVTSSTHIVEPSAPAIHSKEGIFGGIEQTVAAPVVIQEDWVGCDRCQKWRLLPYGTKSEQLPDKWVCSMLDWLPGMNRCDISEDETTKAVHASYLVPVPENQQYFRAHDDGNVAGVISANAHDFNLNHQNSASGQMKQQKLKQKPARTGDPVPSNDKKHLQQLAAKKGSSKEKQSLAEVNATKKSDMQDPNKSAIVVAKLNKRKAEGVIGDDANPRKKIKKESEQHVTGKVKKIKSKGALTVDNFPISGGNPGMIGHSLTSGLPNKAAVKDGKKKSAQKDAVCGGAGNVQIYDKKQKDQMHDLPGNGPLSMKTCNGREASSKKIKLKDYSNGQHQVETRQNNESNLQDRKVSIKEDSKDGDFHRDKKSRVSQIEEKEFKRSQNDDILKRRSAEPRVQSSGSKEYPINGCVEKEQQVTKPRAKLRLTIEDIDKLRKDLGCEQLSTAATSSSSKVSDSRKNRISYMEANGSPEESVSSSPVRRPYRNQVSPMMMGTSGKVNARFNDIPTMGCLKKFRGISESTELGIASKGTSGLTNDNGLEVLVSKNKLKQETDVDDNHYAPKHEVSSNLRHRFSDGPTIKSVKNGRNVGKRDLGKSGGGRSDNQSAQREHDKNDVKSSYPCSPDITQQNLNQDFRKSSAEQISTQMEPWNGKLRIDLRQGDKQCALYPRKHESDSLKSSMDSRALNASVVGDKSKALKDTAIAHLQNGTEDFVNNEVERSVALDVSLGNKNVSGVMASTALKEAEDVLKKAEELRSHADLIKNSGFGSESNYEYFKAALKFLYGASLLEACNGESGKHLEMSPMQMYGAAAKLCTTCACEYEKNHEMAAAALAYKCVEVAYLKVVYCKSSTTYRVWHDLTLQMVPQGESPSSSASDIDNLNNLATADKTSLSKSSGSHAGNHVLVPRNRPNFVRLLDFTKDVNSAMEAAKKSQDTFAAACIDLEESQNKDAIVSIKRVIDFSFQNVEELVHLIWLAFNTINHQGLSGGRQ